MIVWHGKNLNVEIFFDTVNVKLRMMALFIELFPVHTTFDDLDYISRSQQCQIVLPETVLISLN